MVEHQKELEIIYWKDCSKMKKVLIETHHLYYWPNFLPVVQAMLKRGTYDIYVSMPVRSSQTQENILSNACEAAKISFLSADTEDKRIKKLNDENFDIIIVGNVGQLNKISSSRALVVMVYHGIGLKQSYYTDIDPRVDIRSVESVARFNELKSHGHDNIVLTGYTKLDRLVNFSDPEIKFTNQKIELDPDKKSILYAPSFYPTSIDKLHPYLLELSQDHNIIIKLHGFGWEQKKYQYQNILCTELSKKSNSIHLLQNEDYDIVPYYLHADMLISDISSTLFEYLPMDKPIIQAQCYNLKLKHRIFKKRFWKKMDIDRQDNVDFAYQIVESDDILGMVYYAMDNHDEMSTKRKEATEHYLYKVDGNASSRLIDAIEAY